MSMRQGLRPATSPALIDAFKGLATGTIADVLDDLGIGGVGLNLHPLANGMRCVGAAITVKEITGTQNAYLSGDFAVGKIIESAGPLDVIVIDNAGQQVSTWGGVASAVATFKGVAGLVVDGGVRDADDIIELGFAVFPRHVVPLSGKTRIKVIEINTPVMIDGITVNAGDIMVGDSTGIVCIPLAHAAEVARLANRLGQQDRQAVDLLRKGLTVAEAQRRFPKL